MVDGSSGLCKVNGIKIDKRPWGLRGSALDFLDASCYSTSSYGHLLLHGPHTHACATTRTGHFVCECVCCFFLCSYLLRQSSIFLFCFLSVVKSITYCNSFICNQNRCGLNSGQSELLAMLHIHIHREYSLSWNVKYNLTWFKWAKWI